MVEPRGLPMGSLRSPMWAQNPTGVRDPPSPTLQDPDERRVRVPVMWWTQWSVAGTDDHGFRSSFPHGIKASAPIPRTEPMTR